MHERQTSIYLIRHADTKPDADLAFADANEYDDLPLNARGLEQAAALARRLGETLDLRAIYSSAAKRAQQTARALATPFGLGVEIDQRLREVALSAPSIEHLPLSERGAVVRAHLENLAVIAMRDGSWSALPGTEPAAKIRERMREGIDAIAARHPGQAVAAVSHAGSINAFVADLLGIQRDFFFPAGNTSVTVVRYTDYGKILVRLNDTAHLESLRV